MKNKSLKILTAVFLFTAFFTKSNAQYDFDFEDIPVDSASYINGSNGFKEYKKVSNWATIKMNTQYDTQFKYWSGGWAYSRVYDSTTKASNFSQLYSSKGYTGAIGSKIFAVGTQGSGMKFENTQGLRYFGLHIANSTYAYNSMRLGDAFAKKFGGKTGNDPDFFLLTIKTYLKGIKYDSFNYYLADFKTTLKSMNSDWVNAGWILSEELDSVSFHLSSSDVGSFGMNTPAYFTIDNVIYSYYENTKNVNISNNLTLIPNPAKTKCLINSEQTIKEMYLLNAVGQKIFYQNELNQKQVLIKTSNLAHGYYTVVVRTENGVSTSKLLIQE